jgi:hypothetical protein
MVSPNRARARTAKGAAPPRLGQGCPAGAKDLRKVSHTLHDVALALEDRRHYSGFPSAAKLRPERSWGMRPLRHLPPGTLHEISARTIDGRHWLRPTPAIRSIVVGAIAHAQGKFGLEIHALAVMSNHLHLLVTASCPTQVARFMSTVLSTITREVSRLHNRRGRMWDGPYHCIRISAEPAAQIGRLCYVLGHGAKERVVADPRRWPGAHSAGALLDGAPMEGVRHLRTAEHASTPRQVAARPERFQRRLSVVHTPLPCLADLPETVRRARIASALSDWLDVRGLPRLERTPPPHPTETVQSWRSPRTGARSPKRAAPRCHASTGAERERLVAEYRQFVDAYRVAAADLAAGRVAVFPPWCFPPRPPASTAGIVVQAIC